MTMRTTEDKIRLCIKFLQSHGYQVIFPTRKQNESAERKRLVEASRERILAMGGASAATLMSIKEVAALLHCSIQHITNMVEDGRFPPPAIHEKRWKRWRLEDVQAYAKGDAGVRGTIMTA